MIERVAINAGLELKQESQPIGANNSFLISSNQQMLPSDMFRREWDALPKTTDPTANRAVTTLLGQNGSPDRLQYSVADAFTPGLGRLVGLAGSYSDGKGFALINTNNIQSSARSYVSNSGLGMTQGEFTSTVIANELAGKIVDTEKKYEKLTKIEKEFVSDTASMGVTENFAFKILATNAQFKSAQEADNYSAIYEQTAETLERTISANPGLKGTLTEKLKETGRDPNKLGEGAMHLFYDYALNNGGSIPDRFVGFSQDVLGARDGVQLGKDFARNMKTDFNNKANQLINK